MSYFNKVCLYIILILNFVSLVMKFFFQLVSRGHCSYGSFISCFQEEKGRLECLLVHGIFQVPSAPNNPYVKEVYFGMIYSASSITIRCYSGGFDFGHSGPYLVDLLSISFRIQISGPAFGCYTLGSLVADIHLPGRYWVQLHTTALK